MQCIISNQNLRILVRGLHSLSRIGDELYVEPTKDGMSFRTVNAAQSAYSSLFFNLSFFSRYKCDFQTDEAGTCKISMRACLRVFKTPNCMDRHVESCKIEIEEECLKLIFKIQYTQGYTKTHLLSVNDNETVQLKYNKNEMKNEVSILPRTLHKSVKYFGPKDEEITFDVTEDQVYLKNYFDNTEVENQKVVRTKLSLHRSEFETYNVTQPNSITFALRELRAVCAFSESSNSVICMHFEKCGKPVIFNVDNPLYQADYVVSTLPPEIISGERPYRRSQLSDIASSMPSNSVVNSTRKRRLAPVTEENPEPIASLPTESSAEQNPTVHVVQAEVHQAQSCASIVQKNRSQNNQQSSQNNATNIAPTQRNSQINSPNVSPTQRYSENNTSNFTEVQRNSQNNSFSATQIRTSQNNSTYVTQARTRSNSQNNVICDTLVERNSQNNSINVAEIQSNSRNNQSSVVQVQHRSQNNTTNAAQVSSRCSFGTSNESDTNLDELMMRIDMNSEYFQNTNQKTVTDYSTGVDESHLQKIETVFQYCFNFPLSHRIEECEILREEDD
ncbi:cell cycle checkpoint control protein RAD9B [Planococcus citri]|uniref:cell cycle checkpoint control protein RAD9B n=1 Tax=Planococcus citri TaxID=170843 RepID=UPI0031FA1E3E